jgi:hypothetical protein
VAAAVLVDLELQPTFLLLLGFPLPLQSGPAARLIPVPVTHPFSQQFHQPAVVAAVEPQPPEVLAVVVEEQHRPLAQARQEIHQRNLHHKVTMVAMVLMVETHTAVAAVVEHRLLDQTEVQLQVEQVEPVAHLQFLVHL